MELTKNTSYVLWKIWGNEFVFMKYSLSYYSICTSTQMLETLYWLGTFKELLTYFPCESDSSISHSYSTGIPSPFTCDKLRHTAPRDRSLFIFLVHRRRTIEISSFKILAFRNINFRLLFIFQIDLNSESRNPFNFNHVKDLVDACYNKQTPINRLKISIVMMISTLSLLQISGKTTGIRWSK